jgi:hypothetical protein
MGLSSALLGSLGLFLALPSLAGDDDFHTYGPIAVQSDGDGELSTGIYTINVTTAGTLMVNYVAPRAHCSSLRMHFLLDGRQKSVSGEIAPGQRTDFVDFGPVSPGSHVIGLQAEGIPGGCNTGRIQAWEGSAEVWTSLPQGDMSRPPRRELGDIFFDVNYVNYAGGSGSRGTVVTAEGLIFSYGMAPNGVIWPLKANTHGLYSEADLLERFSRGGTLLGHVRTDGFEQIKRLALKLGNDGDFQNAPTAPGADQGETTYRVFRRHGSTGEYEAQLIGQSGDRQWTNSTVEGVALKGWLIDSLKPDGHESAPHHIVCVTYPCP